jgi:hypothetical protein
VLNDRALAERLSISASRHARTELTWHEAQKKLLNVYERVLNE